MVYIGLLGEGVRVYRPVPSELIESDIYVIGGQDIYDPEVEEWEFSPDTRVIVEEMLLSGELVLVATAIA